MDAVVLFSKSIDKFYRDNCRRNSKTCEAIHTKFDGERFFYEYMVNMDFQGNIFLKFFASKSKTSGYSALEGHSRISLNCDGDSIPWNTHGKYNIWQIQADGSFKVRMLQFLKKLIQLFRTLDHGRITLMAKI